jgi:membrane-bound lytic murein transglycosylase D
LRQQVEEPLQQAQAAVQQGDEESFQACEATIVRQVSQSLAAASGDVDLQQAVSELYAQLDDLTAALYAEEAGDEEPPVVPEEVVPAAPEQVEKAARQAQEVTFDLPVKVTPEVASLVEFYTGPYREKLTAALARAASLLPFIRQELTQRGLPQDLAWLPLVESAFQTHARSRAKAMGLWQFMAGTARLNGLRCDGLVDERLDPYRATQAALAHLAHLYATFGDWELALAAYNSGAGRVEQALRRAKGSRDFWSLRRFLPRETRNYVPAFWAALIVAKQPEKYGLPTFPEQSPCRDLVTVEGALDLEVLAERGGFDLALLRELNPALVRGITPPQGTYPVAVPCGQGDAVRALVAAIPEKERIKRLFHRVQAGETLARIARRYGVSVDTLMAANAITNPRALRVGRELVIPKGPWQPEKVATSSSPAARSQSLRNPLRYRVKPGDTLYSIARKHGTTVEAIQARNKLSGTVIRPGDVLYLAP